MDDFEGEVEHEDHDGWGEVGKEFEKAQIEELEADEEAGPLAGLRCEFLPHLFEGVGSSVDLLLLQTYQLVDALHWLHLRVHIGHIDYIAVVLVDAQAEHSSLS